MTYPLELQLRLLIREHLMSEAAPAPEPVDEYTVYRAINEGINTAEWWLAAADLVVIGGVAASGGAAAPAAAMYLKASGIAGGIMSFGQAAIYFADPKGPFIVKGCMEILEGIVSLLTTPAVARMTSAGVKLGWRVLTELIPVIQQVLTWIAEKLFPGFDPSGEVKNEIKRSVEEFLRTKAKSVTPGVDIGHLVQELAVNDSESGLPEARRSPEDVDIYVQQETGLPGSAISEISDDIYALYIDAFDGSENGPSAPSDVKPAAGRSQRVKKQSSVSRISDKISALTALPDPAGFIRDYKYDSQNGDLRWMGSDPYMGTVVGNLYTMKPGDTIPPSGRIKFVGIETASNGSSIEKVVVKGPAGDFFKVRSMYS